MSQYRVEVKPHGGQQLDVTAYACSPLLVAALNGCGVNCCPLAFEKGPLNQSCSLALYGPPVWSSDALGLVPTDNPWTMKVAEGDGALTIAPFVMAARDRPNSIRVLHAFAGIPACDVAPDGTCR